RWSVGSGTWAPVAGEAQQQNTAGGTEMYATGFGSQTNYRITAKMHAVTGIAGGALEISFRLNTSTGAEWHCNWEPVPQGTTLYLRLQQSGQATAVDVPIDVSTVPGYSNTMTVTMQVVVVSSNISCSILEIPAATATLNNALGLQ